MSRPGSPLAALALAALATFAVVGACHHERRSERAADAPASATTTAASAPHPDPSATSPGEAASAATVAAAFPAQGEPDPSIGGAPGRAPPSRCPPEMALVGGTTCVDRWEASLVDEAGEPWSPYHAVGARRVRAVSRPGVVPQAHIGAADAGRACVRGGKRLCTTAEWILACQGAERPPRAYPYGQKKVAGACNVERAEHPVTRVFGKHLTDSVALNSARLNQLPDSLARTGEFSSCATPEGVMDLHGNLLEWTESTYVRPLGMGGHYVDGVRNGIGCGNVTSAHDPKYHDFSTGFRCCQTPDPEAAPAPGPAPSAAGRADAGRDPPGMRSFVDPTGRLPSVAPPPFESASARCPVDMVHVEAMRCAEPVQRCKRWLPRLSAGQKISCAEFEEPTTCEGTRRKLSYCIDRFEFQPDGYQYPLTHVNWNEAQNLCRAMDKRLCFEDEWELACEGPDALPYPYGHVRDGARCNHDFPEEQLVTSAQDLIDRRVARDALPGCRSPFGVFNLVGNVDEWTTRYQRSAPRRAILRGGWWLIGRNRCRAATDNHSELYAGVQTGFRCCRAPR